MIDTSKRMSISDLERVSIETDSPAGKAFRLLFLGYKQDYYDEFVELLGEYLDEIFASLNEARKNLQNDGEDRLNVHVVMNLKLVGFDAEHDAETGGHCDIHVRYKKALWIGEAKRIASNEQEYIKKGMLQLTERYASGLKYQTEGALIIYCFAPNAQKVLSDLSTKLSGSNYEVEDKVHEHDLKFRASKTHTGTGNTYSVTNYVVPLYHNPPV